MFKMKQGPRISREVEFVPGCAATVAGPSCPDYSLEPPGPGRIISEHVGLVTVGENSSICMVVPWCLPRRESFSLVADGDWVRKGSYHTAWSVLRVLVHMRMGNAPLSGHTLESGAGHCEPVFGGLSHP